MGETRRPELITDFDYDAIDGAPPSEMIEFTEMVAVFSLILAWMTKRKSRKDLILIGAHAAALQFFLDPTRSEFRSLADIAASANVSRASLSKSLLNLRDESGVIAWQCGKPHSSREVYSRVQVAIHAGGSRKAPGAAAGS